MLNSKLTKTLFLLVVCLAATSLLKAQIIKGKVTDANGKSLPFATIKFGATKQGMVADLEGNFTFEMSDKFHFITVSYTGYETKKINLSAANDNFLSIKLNTAAENLNEVVIVSDAPKVKRILNRTINNRSLHNPDNYDWYRCNIYYKMTADVLLADSVIQKMEKDTSKEGREDARITRQLIKDQHIFMTETFSRRTWQRPQRLQEEVIASRVSGFKRALFTSFVTDVLPFHSYNDYIVMNGKNYNNPVSKGYWQRYKFRLTDEIYQGKDTIWIISYNAKNADQLSGTVFISSDKYAITNLVAHHYDSILKRDVGIEQQYVKRDDRWFPNQLNYSILWKQIGSTAADAPGIFMKGTSTIDSVSFETDRKFRFDRAHTVKLLPNAIERNDTVWNSLRPQPLNSKEKLTYTFIDSVGNELKIDKIALLAEKLVEGKIPYKSVDLDLKRFYSYNRYEKHRLGLGLQTNDKLFKNLSIGGWFGYGTGDKEWKYGAFAEYYADPYKEFVFRFSYDKDISDPGRIQLHKDLDKNYLRMFLLTRVDAVESYKFSVRKRLGYLNAELSALSQTIQPQYDYALENKGLQYNSFEARELSLTLRYAYGERTAPLFGKYFSSGTKFPIVYGRITTGNIVNTNNQYVQAVGAIAWQKQINRIGTEKFLVVAGRSLSEQPLPVSKLFAGNGFLINNVALYAFGGMQTILPYDFYTDRFINTYWNHEFNWKLYRLKISRTFSSAPSIGLSYNMLWGRLSNRDAHKNISFSVPEPAYHETGILLNRILRYKYMEFAYLNFNAGYFTRVTDQFNVKETGRFVMGVSFDL